MQTRKKETKKETDAIDNVGKISRKIRDLDDLTLYTLARGNTRGTSVARKKKTNERTEFPVVLRPLPTRARERNNLLSS